MCALLFKLASCCAAMGLLCLFPTPSFATMPNCGDKPIRLAFYEHAYFYFENAEHQFEGIDKDLIDELARRSGCTFQTLVMVRARIWADLANGDLDMSVLGIQTPQREQFAWFVHYLRMKNFAIVLQHGKDGPKTPEEFISNPHYTFGVVRGYKHGQIQDAWLDQLRQADRVQESPNAEIIFKKLQERRVDAMYAQAPMYGKKIQEFGLQNEVEIQDWAPHDKGVEHGLVLAKTRFQEKDAQAWKHLIDVMRADGSLRKIYMHYVGAAEADKLLERK